jgi:hypothetical protein
MTSLNGTSYVVSLTQTFAVRSMSVCSQFLCLPLSYYRHHAASVQKIEGSPSEVEPAHAASDAASPDMQQDDHFSDDDQETELEALHHLGPEERRKALR